MLHPNDSLRNVTDTVADVGTMVASVRLLPLLRGEINVDELTLKRLKLNTANFIGDLRIKCELEKLHIHSHGVNINNSYAKVDFVETEGGWIDVALGDTMPKDTSSKALWQIKIDKASLAKTRFRLHMPGDTMNVSASFDGAVANNAELLLHDNIYKVGSVDWHGGSIGYVRNHTPYVRNGFDTNHISISDINLGIDSFVYSQSDISMRVRAANFKERSGICIKALSTHFSMTGKQIRLPDFNMTMPQTSMSGKFWMDFNAFDDKAPGHLFADFKGRLNLTDIMPLLVSLPRQTLNALPQEPFQLSGRIYGNLEHLKFQNVNIDYPSAFTLTTTGYAANIANPRRHLKLNARVRAATRNMGFASRLMPRQIAKEIRIPSGLTVDGTINIDGSRYAASLSAKLGGGRLTAKGFYDTAKPSYSVKASARRFDIGAFAVRQRIGVFTGYVNAHGHGTDFMQRNTGIALDTRIDKLRYGRYTLDGISGRIRMNGGRIDALANSHNTLIGGRVHVNGTIARNRIDLHMTGNIANADLRALGLTDKRWLLSTRANVRIKSDLRKTHYIIGNIDDINLWEKTRHGTASLVSGSVFIDGSMRNNRIGGLLRGNIGNADLYRLGISEKPFAISMNTDIDFDSDLKEDYRVNGSIGNIIATENGTQYMTNDMTIYALSRSDTTHLAISSDDFDMRADAHGSYKGLTRSIEAVARELKSQTDNKRIDQPALQRRLPEAHVVLRSGADNMLTTLLADKGYRFKHADIDITSSPLTGLNGTAVVNSLVYNDSTTIDSINIALNTKDDLLRYAVAVINNSSNAYPYKGYVDGTFYERGILARTTILDTHDKTAIDFGLRADMHGDGIRTSIASQYPVVIGYKTFTVNDSNYVYIGRDRRLSADIRLLAGDGAGAQLYTDDSDSTSLQNVTLSMHDFELGKLLTVIPFAPNITGKLNGDYHVIQTTDELTVSGDMTVGNMTYGGCAMGDVGANLVYMPQGDGTHYVDAILSKDGRDIGQLTGTYDSKDKGYLNANLSMEKFPMDYIDGFVPDKIVGFRGNAEGSLSITGQLDDLNVNGELYLDSSSMYSEPYGFEMRFADDPVTIKDSRLLFENFEMFANNDQPLNIAGYLDFHNPSNMYVDARMRADNFELIDSKENSRSTIYGKAFVNFIGGIRGHMDDLRMGGQLNLLGNTDMTYVMRDTPLSTDDNISSLVKFTNFNDSTPDDIARPTIAGFQVDLGINIDEQAHIVAALNEQHSNFIDLIGGGDLTLHYDQTNETSLRGRYTLNSGQMKYSLDMIPLRTFNIQQGSYIEFNGAPGNPSLNITATENVKANYSGTAGNDRLVNFTAGVHLTNTLEKPGIEFIVSAPEDTEAQNDLNTKSAEEKGKIAVTLLASGMYISDGKGGNYAMSGALASFMQNQINNVTGRALGSMGLDISANMESSADARGALHTDYTFNFSKRLWNNRLRIMMGGRVSTGSTANEDNGAYFDNFSIEYRLNRNETQYLKLYYDRQAYDWLEGDVGEFGAGFMWRRKLQHFKDIFRFKSSNPAQQRAAGADSLIRFNPNESK